MPALTDLDPDDAAAVLALAGRLKHDLGRYVAFQGRWLPDESTDADRLQALRDDLLATRRGPDGTSDALEVWGPYAARLLGREPLDGDVVVDLREDPAVRRLVADMDTLADLVAELRAGEPSPDRVRTGLGAARAVAEACRDLHRRAREHAPHG